MNEEARRRMMDNTKGLIFNIIHGSFVDGYGIRTTIFLKGCPFKCVWCCNPEGQSFDAELRAVAADCNGCGNCAKACPEKAVEVKEDGDKFSVNVDRKLCTNCGKCIDVCYTGALSFYGKDYTLDEMFEVIKKDEQFYRSSGGGVTIGGGEATWYPGLFGFRRKPKSCCRVFIRIKVSNQSRYFACT